METMLQYNNETKQHNKDNEYNVTMSTMHNEYNRTMGTIHNEHNDVQCDNEYNKQ